MLNHRGLRNGLPEFGAHAFRHIVATVYLKRYCQIIVDVCLDKSNGTHYNNPSFGCSGYSVPKDTKQLLAISVTVPQNLCTPSLMANTTRKDFVAAQIICKQLEVVGIYRLEMNTVSDNFRASSIQCVMKRSKAKGIEVIVHGLVLRETEFYNSRVVNELANRSVDALVDVADSKVYRSMRESVIFNGRNLYEPVDVREAGFHYKGIGRRT